MHYMIRGNILVQIEQIKNEKDKKEKMGFLDNL